MTTHLTPADFAAVPWGGRAIPPKGRECDAAVRAPWNSSDMTPWAVQRGVLSTVLRTDAQMALDGWTLPVPDAPTDPWDAAPDMLQAMWDTGEERDGEAGEWTVFRRSDGTLTAGVTDAPWDAAPCRRFRPRPRPSWQDAEVVEASMLGDPERRLFQRGFNGERWWHQGGSTRPEALIDPVPMTVQKKEER